MGRKVGGWEEGRTRVAIRVNGNKCREGMWHLNHLSATAAREKWVFRVMRPTPRPHLQPHLGTFPKAWEI